MFMSPTLTAVAAAASPIEAGRAAEDAEEDREDDDSRGETIGDRRLSVPEEAAWKHATKRTRRKKRREGKTSMEKDAGRRAADGAVLTGDGAEEGAVGDDEAGREEREEEEEDVGAVSRNSMHEFAILSLAFVLFFVFLLFCRR